MRSLQASIACRSSSEVDTPMKDYGKNITRSGTSETKFKCVVYMPKSFANSSKRKTINYDKVRIL